MGYASKLAQTYSNPNTSWNSLGALGSTSAWDQSSPVAQTALYRLKNSGRNDRTYAIDISDDAKRLFRDLKDMGVAPRLSSLRPKRPALGDLNLESLMGYTGDNVINFANQSNNAFMKQALAGRFMGSLGIDSIF